MPRGHDLLSLIDSPMLRRRLETICVNQNSYVFYLSCFKLFPEENRSEFQGQAEQVLLYLELL